MSIGSCTRWLIAVQCKVAHFYLKTKWSGVKAAQFDPGAGNPLQLIHQATANHRLEGIRGCIPEQTGEQKHACDCGRQKVFPDFAPTRLGAGSCHLAWPPETGSSVRISLPARRFCSHAVSNWFTFCWVSSSLIFGV